MPRTLAVQVAMIFQYGNSTAVGQTIVAVGQTTVACRLIDRTCFITYDGNTTPQPIATAEPIFLVVGGYG